MMRRGCACCVGGGLHPTVVSPHGPWLAALTMRPSDADLLRTWQPAARPRACRYTPIATTVWTAVNAASAAAAATHPQPDLWPAAAAHLTQGGYDWPTPRSPAAPYSPRPFPSSILPYCLPQQSAPPAPPTHALHRTTSHINDVVLALARHPRAGAARPARAATHQLLQPPPPLLAHHLRRRHQLLLAQEVAAA